MGEGLEAALEKTIEQLADQSNMQFHLNFKISEVPLSPMEEIHLLQIAREASQNCVHHSQGNNVWISLTLGADKHVELLVKDDGIGLSNSRDKLNHYGMAIMQERAKHLHGELFVEDSKSGGAEVKLVFRPVGGTQNY